MAPIQIKIKEKKYLYIKWQDSTESSVRLTSLRRICPCAMCSEERLKQGKDYIPIYNDDQVAVLNVKLVGYYGLNVHWKDGHKLGIYEYELLRRIAEQQR
ncbi:MAG TPA: DUF971 domain-containing protein [Ignavibacteriales bacterium]|nr:DUF971 domain-containing protein [Ignavibacteriales bacterium]